MAFLSDLGEAARWLSAAEHGTARVHGAALARRLRERAVGTVGLLPASDQVAVPPVAVHLARALADASGSRAAVLDADGSWASAPPAAEGASPTVRSWLRPDLAVLALARGHAPLDAIRAAREQVPEHWAHVVVDLTGLDRRGEHLGALEAMDAVVLVARAGSTRLSQLRRALADVHPEHYLGVLLTGA
jgi:Mrp family chromosome partitioning ATPase